MNKTWDELSIPTEFLRCASFGARVPPFGYHPPATTKNETLYISVLNTQIAKPQWPQPWRRHPAKWPHSFGVKNAQRRISFQAPTYCVAIRGPQLDFMHQDMFMLSCAYIPLVWSFLCSWLPTWKSKWPGAIPTKSSFTISENHHSALWTYEGTRLLWSKQLAHLWSRNQALLQALRDRFLGKTGLLCNSH